jgi:hypothetical protein
VPPSSLNFAERIALHSSKMSGGDNELVSIRVRWRQDVHEVSLPRTAPVSHLAAQLSKLTHLAPETLRVVSAGKTVALAAEPARSIEASGLASATSVGRPPLLLLGQTAADIDAVRSEADHASDVARRLREPTAEHAAAVAKGRAGASRPAVPTPPTGEFTFASYTTLHGGALILSSRQALYLLYRLASDPGIVAVMQRHRWRVGLLSEMPPEGKVGVSAVCVLGYNVNHGQEISLRLRTDDMRGFRRYDRIRETLIHELAHMVYGEHDLRFKALNSQLTREAAAADVTRSAVGRTIGAGSTHQGWLDALEADDTPAGGHVLGGTPASGAVSPGTAAAEAASRRRRAAEAAAAEAAMAAEAADALTGACTQTEVSDGNALEDNSPAAMA